MQVRFLYKVLCCLTNGNRVQNGGVCVRFVDTDTHGIAVRLMCERKRFLSGNIFAYVVHFIADGDLYVKRRRCTAKGERNGVFFAFNGLHFIREPAVRVDLAPFHTSTVAGDTALLAV